MLLQRLRMMLGLMLVALLLISCKEDKDATTIPDEVPASISDLTGDGESQTGDEASLTVDEESQAIDDEKSEPRTELSATNPGSVKLGSGRVTLVEFFAFW